MKLVTYTKDGKEQVALYIDSKLYNVNELNSALPADMATLLLQWEENSALLRTAEAAIISGTANVAGIDFAGANLLAPVPHPTSCRDGYAFRQHVAAARRNRKVDMIAEFDQYPIFYFTNHNAIQGPGEIPVMPDHLK
ncbi:MAG: fumarylacetoacetate hydrolase family protein, partial [Taibaiella sp.]|nr:fumarylacetoacetate hydrolase family protein [Taibaiella sp.]